MMPRHWCVIGGGMLGLALAYDLARSGERVEVWEGGADLGGLATPWRIGDVVWDRFYHVITSNDARLLHLLGDLELESQIRWTTTQTAFFSRGRLHRFSSAWDFVRFPELSPADKVRLAATIVRVARTRDPRPLENITALDYLSALSGARVVERMWLPLLRAKLGADAERVNAAFIWAIICRMYGARRGPGKQERFGYVPGGYRRILDALIVRLRRMGVALHAGRPVESVHATGDGRVDVAASHGMQRFDRAIVTVPAPRAAAMCRDLLPLERIRLEGSEYQGVVCASLLLKRPLSPFYITNITDPAPFTAVIEMDAVVEASQFGGAALIYLPKYVPSNDPIFDADDDAIRREFVAGLNCIHPTFGMHDVLAFEIARARHVLPIPSIGYSSRIPPFRTTIEGVFVVNSTQIVNGTLNVNQTLELARDALGCMRDTQAPPGAATLQCV